MENYENGNRKLYVHGRIGCSALECSNYGNNRRTDGTTLHRFPRDENRCREWLRRAGRYDLLDIPTVYIQANVSICSAHFEKSSYTKKHKHCLLPDAVPTIFDHKIKHSNGLKNNIHHVANEVSFQSLHCEHDTLITAIKEEAPLEEEPINGALDSVQNVVDFTYNYDTSSLNVLATTEDSFEKSIKLKYVNGSPSDACHISIELQESDDNGDVYRINEPCTVAALKWEIIPYQICRLCASTNELHPKQSIVGWLSMLNMVLPNVVLLNDGLPQHICRPCTNKLHTCNKIVEGFLEADIKLQNGMGFIKTEGLEFVYDPSFLTEDYVQEDVSAFPESGEQTQCSGPQGLTEKPKESTNYETGTAKFDACIVSQDSRWVDFGMQEDEPKVVTGENEAVRKYENKLKYKCTECEDMFTSKRKLYSHKQMHAKSKTHIHTKDKPFMCEHCGKDYRTKYKLSNHQRIHNPPKLICPVCGIMFHTWESYKHHKKKHTDVDRFVCEFCGKTLSTPDSLKTHRRMHTGEKPYKCTTCDMCFISAGMLWQHSFTHSGKCFCCETCGKEFYSKKKLESHQQCHNKLKPYKCPLCLESFSTTGNRGRHLRVTCTNIHCVVCKQTFPSIEMVEEHRAKEHSEDEVIKAAKQYQIRQFARCKICFELVPGNNNLTKHLREAHADYKPFVCDQCPKRFLTKQQLQSHGVSHSDHRPFMCPICHMKFKSKETLKWHDISFHRDVFPFSCPYCNRKFKRQTSLIVHKRTHTGERPYACPICRRAFANKGDMMKHIKTHYSNKRIKKVITEEHTENIILETSGYIWDLPVAEEVIV